MSTLQFVVLLAVDLAILLPSTTSIAHAQRREVAAGSAAVGVGRVNMVATNEWTIGVQLRVGDRSREAEYNRTTVCAWLGNGEETAEYVLASTASAGVGETAEDRAMIHTSGEQAFVLVRIATHESATFGVSMRSGSGTVLRAVPSKTQVRALIDTFRRAVAIGDSLTKIRHGWDAGTCPAT